MSRNKIFPSIGFALLGLCFVIAMWNVLSRTVREADPDVPTIRFAHWQLENGARSAFEALAREYEQLCAARGQRVRVQQIPIPERVFANWMLTQLIGKKAPQIICLDIGRDITSSDRIARFFEPVSDYVNEPNPYNAGTPLAGVPWRETFVDGMATAYEPNLHDYYNVPVSLYTYRLFYNKPLFEKIFGAGAEPPDNYRDFLAACEKITDYGRRHNLKLSPMAGSKYNAPILTDTLTRMQTQKLSPRVNRRQTMIANGRDSQLAYLRGEWGIRSPEITDSLRLLQSVSRHFQPGFQQVSRDTATFYFVQGRSVFIAAGSWDNLSLRDQSPFEIGICRIPVPTVDDPEYGRNMFGPPAEAAKNSLCLSFGLVRGTEHQELALDFLRYLSSYGGNRSFSKQSGWLPSVLGVPVPAELEIFLPRPEGYPNGFGLNNGTETTRLQENYYYLLQTYPDSPERFQSALEQGGYEAACVTDLTNWRDNASRLVMKLDTALAASQRLMQRAAPAAPSHRRTFYELAATQATQEQDIYATGLELSTHRQRKGKN